MACPHLRWVSLPAWGKKGHRVSLAYQGGQQALVHVKDFSTRDSFLWVTLQGLDQSPEPWGFRGQLHPKQLWELGQVSLSRLLLSFTGASGVTDDSSCLARFLRVEVVSPLEALKSS